MSQYKKHLNYLWDGIVFGPDANVSDLIENIMKSNSNYQKNKNEMQMVLISNYVREIWIAEVVPDISLPTESIVDELVEYGTRHNALTDDRTWQKLVNLFEAVKFCLDPCKVDSLSVGLIQTLHRLVGTKVIDDAGEFRTKQAGAKFSTVIYARPSTILGRLEELINIVNSELSDALIVEINAERMASILKIASVFFSEFLLIHPFSNGNGRTARILLNYILKKIVVVPFNIYLGDRKRYIDVLEKRNNNCPPSDLATYVLLACNVTASNVNWLSLN